MKYSLRYNIILLLPILLAACSHGVSPAEYIHYISDAKNGLVVHQKINGIGYALQYQPTNYLVFMEMRSFDVPKDTFKLQYNRFKGLEHYNFHIDRNDLDNLVNRNGKASKKQPASERLSYLDFGIKKDIKLIEGKDTLQCSICECESDGGINPYYSFMLGFPNKDYSGDREFYYDGKKIGAGEVKLTVTESSIKNIPELKLM